MKASHTYFQREGVICSRAANYHGLLKFLSFERDAAFVFLPQFSLSLERCDEGFQVLAPEKCCVDLIIRVVVFSQQRGPSRVVDTCSSSSPHAICCQLNPIDHLPSPA